MVVSACHERPPRPSRSGAVSACHERPPRPSRSGAFSACHERPRAPSRSGAVSACHERFCMSQASPAPVSLGGGFGLSRASPVPVSLGGGFGLSRVSPVPVSVLACHERPPRLSRSGAVSGHERAPRPSRSGAVFHRASLAHPASPTPPSPQPASCARSAPPAGIARPVCSTTKWKSLLISVVTACIAPRHLKRKPKAEPKHQRCFWEKQCIAAGHFSARHARPVTRRAAVGSLGPGRIFAPLCSALARVVTSFPGTKWDRTRSQKNDLPLSKYPFILKVWQNTRVFPGNTGFLLFAL